MTVLSESEKRPEILDVDDAQAWLIRVANVLKNSSLRVFRLAKR